MLNASEELEERVLVVGELGTRGTPLENAHSLQAPAANAPSTCGHDIRPAHRHLGCEAQSIGRCQAPRGVANLAESRKRRVEARGDGASRWHVRIVAYKRRQLYAT